MKFVGLKYWCDNSSEI